MKAIFDNKLASVALITAIVFSLLNFFLPLDQYLTLLDVDSPYIGPIYLADQEALRLIAMAHLAAFITLFAVTPAVIAIVAERANENHRIPIFRAVLYKHIRPLTSILLAASGIVVSLSALLLPGILVSILQSAFLIILTALIIFQVYWAISIQFFSDEKLTNLILNYVSKELHAAAIQERSVQFEISSFRRKIQDDLPADSIFTHRKPKDYTRYRLRIESPDAGKRITKLDSESIIKRLALLRSRIDDAFTQTRNSIDQGCEFYLPQEYGYLTHGDRPDLIYLDVPEDVCPSSIHSWIKEEEIHIRSLVTTRPDHKAELFRKFRETFQKLYEAIAENSLADLEKHLRIFSGFFPPVKSESQAQHEPRSE